MNSRLCDCSTQNFRLPALWCRGNYYLPLKTNSSGDKLDTTELFLRSSIGGARKHFEEREWLWLPDIPTLVFPQQPFRPAWNGKQDLTAPEWLPVSGNTMGYYFSRVTMLMMSRRIPSLRVGRNLHYSYRTNSTNRLLQEHLWERNPLACSPRNSNHCRLRRRFP